MISLFLRTGTKPYATVETDHLINPLSSEKPKKKKSLWRRIKRFFIISSITFIVLLVTAIILAYVFESDIKKYAIQEINKQLTAEVIIDENDISFSFIKKFPKASLSFRNLLILEENKKDTLLFADDISLEFPLLGVFSGDYTVNEMDISNTDIRLRTDKKGKPNYIIWNTNDTTSTPDDTPFKFDLQQINLKKVAVSYHDEPSHFKTNVVLKKTIFSGEFTDKSTDITLNSDHYITFLGNDSTSYFSQKNATANLDVSINTKTELLTIKKGEIAIEKMLLDVAGNYNLSNNTYNLKTNAKNLSMVDVFSLLPNEIAKKLSEYNTEGVIEASGTLEQLKNAKLPNIKASFNLNNGSLTEEKTGAQINGLSFNGSYLLSKNEQTLEVNNIMGNLSGGSFSGNAKLLGLTKMTISSSFSASLDLKEVADFLHFENIEYFEGKMLLNNTFKGTAENGKVSVTEFSGKTDIQNVALKLIDKKYSVANVSGDFNFDRVTSSGIFSGLYGSSDFSISCQVKNIMEYLINDELLDVNTHIQSNQLVVDELLMLANEKEEKSTETEIDPSDTAFKLPVNVITHVTSNIGSLRYGKHELTQFKGDLLFTPDKISSQNISFKANKGIYALNAVLQGKQDGSYQLTADAAFSQIDIKDFFERFDNFGQHVLEARHLKGVTDATVTLKTDLSSALTINKKSVDVVSNFTISNGQLIQFEMFDEMAEYIKGNMIARTFVKVDMLAEKLKHVYFEELTNQLIIKDEKIALPDMVIKSSAMDIGVYGGQTFAGAISYGVNFRLRDVLTKEKDTEYGYIKDDGSGTRMFVSIGGTLDDPAFSLDKEAKKRYAQKKNIEEKENLKYILKKEFGFFKKDTTIKTTPTNTSPIQNSPKFELEWDDEESNDSKKTSTTPNKNTASSKEETKEEEKKKKKGWLDKLVGGSNANGNTQKTTFTVEEE